MIERRYERIAFCSSCLHASEKRNFNEHECRRRSPVMERVESSRDIRIHIPIWPIVKAGDWCGEWERGTWQDRSDENKS